MRRAGFDYKMSAAYSSFEHWARPMSQGLERLDTGITIVQPIMGAASGGTTWP